METKRVYEIDGITYDPDSITVGELRRAGLDPLLGAAPLQVLALLLSRDHTDDEVEAILDRAPEVTEQVTLRSPVTFASESDGDAD